MKIMAAMRYIQIRFLLSHNAAICKEGNVSVWCSQHPSQSHSSKSIRLCYAVDSITYSPPEQGVRYAAWLAVGWMGQPVMWFWSGTKTNGAVTHPETEVLPTRVEGGRTVAISVAGMERAKFAKISSGVAQTSRFSFY
jgi:hypothetical protein